jgi:hypothetical protein
VADLVASLDFRNRSMTLSFSGFDLTLMDFQAG